MTRFHSAAPFGRRAARWAQRGGAALAALAAQPALGQPAADLDAVDRAVAQFTGAAQGQPGGAALPVDRRLRLVPCRTALAVGWSTPRRDSVEVRCPVAGGWTLYVPLAGGGGGAPTPAAIARGDAVSVAVSGDGFAVSQGAEALDSGAIGAWIRVRPLAPGAPVLRARVLRPGAVGIELP